MNYFKRTAAALLCALVLLGALLRAAPAARAETAYADGTYTVAFSVEGLGRHNIAWDTATVYVQGGTLRVDFTLERVDPRNHAPQYDWLSTSCGKFYPTCNDAAYTCTFSGVQVPHLGAVSVVAYSAAMAAEMDYTLHIDDSAIPRADAQPTQSEQPAGEEVVSKLDASAGEEEILTTGATPAIGDTVVLPALDSAAEDSADMAAGEDAAASSAGLSPLAIAAIAAGGAALIGGGAYGLVRWRRGKNDAA